jgi:hypothetical protein
MTIVGAGGSLAYVVYNDTCLFPKTFNELIDRSFFVLYKPLYALNAAMAFGFGGIGFRLGTKCAIFAAGKCKPNLGRRLAVGAAATGVTAFVAYNGASLAKRWLKPPSTQ